MWIDDSKFMNERKLLNLEDIEINDITMEHEQSIKIPHDQDDISCIGGVILKDKTKQIICKNTLDLRIEMAFT